VSGVCSAGLSTTVQPVASAGASFQVAIMIGEFHGMIWPTTPMGSRTVKACVLGAVDNAIVSPVIFVAQPAV
jgi:hypothetical protein